MNSELGENPPHTQNFYKDPIIRFFSGIAKVEGDPRSTILITNGFLELLVECLINAKCRNFKRITQDSRSYPYSVKLVILHEINILNDKTFKKFDWFRKIRNNAAHDPFFEIKSEEIPDFMRPFSMTAGDYLAGVCTSMVGGFWNEHVDLFLPIFAPEMTKAKPLILGKDENPTSKI